MTPRHGRPDKRHAAPEGWRNESGAVTLMVAVLGTAFLVLTAIVVDLGGKIRATQEADAIAREAGRAAAQQVAGAALAGKPSIDPHLATAAAKTWLRDRGIAGSVTVRGRRLTITTSLERDYPILGGSYTVAGRAEIELVRAEAEVGR